MTSTYTFPCISPYYLERKKNPIVLPSAMAMDIAIAMTVAATVQYSQQYDTAQYSTQNCTVQCSTIPVMQSRGEQNAKTDFFKPVFGHFRKTLRVMFASKYLKSTTRYY